MSVRKPLIGMILFLIVSIALSSTVLATLRRGVDGESVSYTARFTDVTGLKAGDDVRMAGIRVGRVDKVSLDGAVAKVRFRVEKKQTVDSRTRASITYQNIVGQRYLGLSRDDRTNPEPLPGNEIPLDRTEPSFDISALLNGFEPLFSVLDPEQVDNITTAVIRSLQGDTGSIAQLIAQTSELAKSLTGDDDLLGRVITNLSDIVGVFARQRGEIDTVVRSTRDVLTGLSAQQDQFLKNIDVTTKVIDRAAVLTSQALPEFTTMLDREPGFLGHFLSNKEAFGYLGFNLPPLLKGLARATQGGAYIETYLCNLNATFVPALSTVIPTIVATATGGSIKQSPICR